MKFYIVESLDGCTGVIYTDTLTVGEQVRARVIQKEDLCGEWMTCETPIYNVIDVIERVCNVDNDEDPFDRSDYWTMDHIHDRIRDDPELIQILIQIASAFYERGRESTRAELARRVHDAIYFPR